MEKLFILGDFAAIIGAVVLSAWTFFKRKWEQLDLMLVSVAMIGCYVFWQTSAPLMRYGYAYVLLLIFVVFGWFMENFFLCGEKMVKVKKISCAAVYFVLVLYGCYKVLMLGDYVKDTCSSEFYIWQENYGVYELTSFEVEGQNIYYPVNGDRTGYEYFPTTTGIVEELEFRGETMKDGFRKKLD